MEGCSPLLSSKHFQSQEAEKACAFYKSTEKMTILNEKGTGVSKSLDSKRSKIKDSVKCPGTPWGGEERNLEFFWLAYSLTYELLLLLLLLLKEAEEEVNKIYLLREKNILTNSFQFT